jgi:hypothetical protein
MGKRSKFAPKIWQQLMWDSVVFWELVDPKLAELDAGTLDDLTGRLEPELGVPKHWSGVWLHRFRDLHGGRSL